MGLTRGGRVSAPTFGLTPKALARCYLRLPVISRGAKQWPVIQAAPSQRAAPRLGSVPRKPNSKFLFWVARQVLNLAGVAAICAMVSKKPRLQWHKASIFGQFFKGVSTALFFSILRKNPSIFLEGLSLFLAGVGLFKHRRFIRRFIILCKKAILADFYPLLGLRFFVAGKISVTGNARKRAMGYRCGWVSMSRLFINAYGSWEIVRTKTGCLGLFFLMYC